MIRSSKLVVFLVFGSWLTLAVAVERAPGEMVSMAASSMYQRAREMKGYHGESYGGYGGYGGYGMMGGNYQYKEKDKDFDVEKFLAIAIPIGIALAAALLALPLLLAFFGPLLLGLVYFIGRSKSGFDFSNLTISKIPHLNVLQLMSEASELYEALSSDESSRKSVVCELGNIIRASDNKSQIISVLDKLMPKLFPAFYDSLKESWKSREVDGKCHKHVGGATTKLVAVMKKMFGVEN